MLSFQQYVESNMEWLAKQPPEVQRKYQPKQPRQKRAPRATTRQFQDATENFSNLMAMATRATAALARISKDRADRYDTWIEVGMALSELGHLGFVIWEEWSKASSKFEPGACGEHWPTFTPGDGLTIGSLDRWADEDDPRPERHADGCKGDCPNRPRVAAHQETIRQLEKEITELRDRNRFVTAAQGNGGIKSASLRDTVVELKKELDRVPLDERQPDQFVAVRPALMASYANSSPSTVGRHLKRLEDHGFIERKVEKTFLPDENAWVSQTFVRPIVDLSDPTVLVVPSEHGGNRKRCKSCNSDKLVRETKIYCAECEAVQSQDVELVNPPEQAEDATVEAPEQGDAGLNFIMRDKEIPTSLVPHPAPSNGRDPSELQDEIQTDGVSVPVARTRQATFSCSRSAPLDVSDPANLPGVRSGLLAPDDPWIALQQTLAKQAMR